MSKKCFIFGTKPMSGHKVSHANNKTKRTFGINLQKISYCSDLLRKKITIRITANTHKNIIKKGGIDQFLLNTNAKLLTEEASLLKTKVKKAFAIQMVLKLDIPQETIQK